MERERHQPENTKNHTIVGPEKIKDLEKALHGIYGEDNEMVQFSGEKVVMLRFIETGETQLRTMKAGETEYAFNVPVRESLPDKEFTDINDFIASRAELSEKYRYNDGAKKEITSPEYLNWKSTLITPDQLIVSAQEMVSEESSTEKRGETLTCTNCSGKKTFHLDCSCKEGGTVFTDLTDNKTIYERKKGETNPGCPRCNGSGKYDNPCPSCQGSGYMTKYPSLRIINEATGQEDSVLLDVASLVANGELKIESAFYERSHASGDERADHKYVIRYKELLKDRMRSIGIDPENAMSVSDNGRVLDTHFALYDEFNFSGNSWSKTDGKINKKNAKRTAKDILQDEQKSIAHNMAWSGIYSEDLKKSPEEIKKIALKRGRVINDENVTTEDVITIRQMRPVHEAFNDLLASITAKGYTLGYTLSFIATGEAGPSFYILNKNGDVVTQLSNEYDIRSSLENAWGRFEKIKNRLKPAK